MIFRRLYHDRLAQASYLIACEATGGYEAALLNAMLQAGAASPASSVRRR